MDEKTIKEDSLVVSLTAGQLIRLVSEVITNKSQIKAEPEYLDVKEAAEYLSYRVSTLRDMVHRRVIPFVKPQHGGRRVYFDRAKLAAWKSARQFPTNEEAFQSHLEGMAKKQRKVVMDKQAEREFLRQNLREAKNLLKILKFMQLLILANKKI